MRFRKEFRRRLVRLNLQISKSLEYDLAGKAEVSGNLLPYLFSVYSFIWCKSFNDLLKK